MKHTLLALDGGYPGQMEALENHFTILRPKGRDPETIIRENATDIRALYTALTPVRNNLIEALPNLEIIAIGAVGYDHVDVAFANKRDIKVTNTPDVLTADTADTALLLTLNVMRRAVEGDAFIRAGMWEKRPLPLGHTLQKKKAGVVGLGRIGRAIAKRLAAFEMDISYHGPNEKTDTDYTYYAELEDMARAVDVLVLACPGGAHTHHLIDHKILKALGPNSFLVNIARGSVVNEEDLLVALHNKDIAGAGLDVFANEPFVPKPLFTMDNVVLTPHIGSATVETRTKMGQIVVGNLLAHFEGEKLLTPVVA